MSLQLAEQYEENEQYDKAYEEYKRLHAKNPDDLSLLERLGHTAMVLDKKDEAAEYYSKIIEKDMTNTLAYEQLMDIYVTTDKYKYYVSRGNLHSVEHQLEHAINDYKKALSHAEDEKQMMTTRFVLANLYEQTGRNMKAVDEYIPSPERDTDKPFLMSIEDVFTISGRGTVVTGRVERGMLKLNDEVEIVGIKPTKKTVVTGIEMFRKQLDYAEAGDNAGVLLRGIAREEVERGQVLAKPGTVTPHHKFKAAVYVLSKEEGGRHTPFFSNYRPQFYFRTTDVTGVITLPEGVEMVMPGDNVNIDVELIHSIALEQGTKFSIREGGRTVGAGNVTEIVE